MISLILSDSHGRTDRIEEAVRRAGKVDQILFLGDLTRDIEGMSFDAPVISVRGNCDGFSLFGDSGIPEERRISVGEYTVLMMHGHTASVKHTTLNAIAKAQAADADVLLFGHTHIPICEYLPEGYELYGARLKKPLYIFNPGSIGRPAEGRPSFGIMTVRRGGGILLSHGYLA
ncbi:MAG: YfcE family phosphodiesterase [Ruminococcaceae bacterium]|nr:YfcE family phosphodiesterase [Oscillospiraceae bacterium]